MVQKIVIICGPTAVGKSRVGALLAKKFQGEIVSADSQQVWKRFDVGTAKPSGALRSEVRHHLIDVAEPAEVFDAARFVSLADAAIADIASRGRRAFVVGGTGMYLRMLVSGFCDAPPRDEGMRSELEAEIEQAGPASLHRRLAKIDPASAESISQNDRTRIVRALEIYEITGTRPSELRAEHGFGQRRYDALKIGLDLDREELYRRIDERVDGMIEAGLADEARGLLERYGRDSQPFAAVGYKEMASFIAGEIDLAEAVRLIKQNTRRLAKRQLTWFRADQDVRWFAPDDMPAILAAVQDFHTLQGE